MRKSIIVGAVALVAVAAGVVYLNGEKADQSAAPAPSASNETSGAAPAAGAAPADGGSRPGSAAAPASRADAKPLPPDPRLSALQVSPDNGLIKFVLGENGKVIAEIDQDPASLGYGKPSREYTYAGDRVVQLTAYRYMSDHVEVTRTMVAYKPDGSVADVRESTSYEKKRANQK